MACFDSIQEFTPGKCDDIAFDCASIVSTTLDDLNKFHENVEYAIELSNPSWLQNRQNSRRHYTRCRYKQTYVSFRYTSDRFLLLYRKIKKQSWVHWIPRTMCTNTPTLNHTGSENYTSRTMFFTQRPKDGLNWRTEVVGLWYSSHRLGI